MTDRQFVPCAACVDRRTFLRSAVAVTAIAGVTPIEGLAPGAQATAWKRTPCRLCGVGCGLLVGIQRGRAVAVRGDPESPASQGSACVKGYYSVQALYGRDRITQAHERRDAALVPMAIGPALDRVAQRIRDAVASHGPDSVALYGSAQWTAADALVAARLFRGAIGSAMVDTSARLHTASAAAGLRSTFGAPAVPGGYHDLDHADVFVIWNANLAETDPVLFSRMLERRRVNPAVRLIDIASRTTRTSYAADRAFLLRPQSEGAVALAIAHELVAKGLANRDFVRRHVAITRGAPVPAQPDGLLASDAGTPATWEELEAFLGTYTPEWAERESGIRATDIRWLATLYGDPTRAVVSAWGTQVNNQARGTWLNNALHNLHLLAGKVASPGNAAMPLSGQPGGAALIDDALGHHAVPSDPADRERLAELLGVAADALPSSRSRPALSIFDALERGEISVLWIQATNPMVSLPHLSRFRAAARRADTFIVVSEAYPTPTTDIADLVLPAALWIEREGIYVNGERRVQHFERMVRPTGDCLTDARQMMEVARRLGHGAVVPWDDDGVTAATWDVLRRASARDAAPLPALDDLRAAPGLTWPSHDGREVLWQFNSAYDPAADPARGAFDFHRNPDHQARLWLHPYEPATEHPDDEYPFWFGAVSVVEHWGTGSLTRRIPTLHRAVPASWVEVHAADARRLGIRDGDLVRLTSRRGSTDLEARIDYRGQPPRGQLFAPRFDEGAAVNLLTGDTACPVSGQPAYHACAVRVTRVRRDG